MEAAQANRFSPGAGSNPFGRKAQRNALRIGRGRDPRTASLTLGRFHPVNLQPKLGVVVYDKLQILEKDDNISLENIYDDLWTCYERYVELYYGEKITINYKDTTDSISTAFEWMLVSLGQMLGESSRIDIVEDWQNGKPYHYCFHAYTSCFTNEQWSVIEVGPAFKKLRRSHKEDLNIFILFMSAFRDVGIQTWFYGDMVWMLEDTMPEDIANGDCEPETVRDIRNTIRKYESGLPAQVANDILTSYTHIGNDGKCSVDLDYLELINLKTKSEPIRKIIAEGIKIVRQKKNIWQYCFIPSEWEDEMGLGFDCQFTIVWDIEDTLGSYYEDHINVIGAEGLFQPYINLKIDKNCDRLFIPDQFTRDLSNFFDYAVDQINIFMDYKNKKNERAK